MGGLFGRRRLGGVRFDLGGKGAGGPLGLLLLLLGRRGGGGGGGTGEEVIPP